MVNLEFIFGPLVGGVIGYITNALAIRMLFRPYKAKYIFGWRIPFTPGIIPKEKGRIAISLGTAISDNLMNQEVLEKNLLSPEMVEKVRQGIESFVAQQKANDETVREFLAHYLTPEEADAAIANIKDELAAQVGTRLSDSRLGDQIADAVVAHMSAKLRIDGLAVPLSGLIGKKVWGQIADLMQAPARSFLSKNINQLLRDRGQEIIGGLLDKEVTKLADTPVKELLAGKDEQLQQLCDAVVNMYRKLITEQLPKILATINIPAIIESRINEMNMAETEKLIFSVMNKELRAIIWLGALLGTIMGTINAFV